MQNQKFILTFLSNIVNVVNHYVYFIDSQRRKPRVKRAVRCIGLNESDWEKYLFIFNGYGNRRPKIESLQSKLYAMW